jgi:hypothetical protein
MRYVVILLSILWSSAQAKSITYTDVCERWLSDRHMQTAPEAQLDGRTSREIFMDLQFSTSAFKYTHTGYDWSTAIELANSVDPDIPPEALIKPEEAMGFLEKLTTQFRFGQELAKGEYFPPDATEFHPRNGWPLEAGLWLNSQDVPELDGVKNVRLNSVLFPSKKFVQILGWTPALRTIIERKVDFLRYDPTVVAFVPLSIFVKKWSGVVESLPQFRVKVEEEDNLKKAKGDLSQLAAPTEKSVFSAASLETLLKKIKTQVDQKVGPTQWTVNIRTLAAAPFPERSEVMVKFDHPDVNVAWRASLEFLDLYAQALRGKVSGLELPQPGALPMEFIPTVQRFVAPDAPNLIRLSR